MTRPRHSQLSHLTAKDLRSGLTISEARVWGAIEAGKTGARFRRQVPIGNWIVDFACLELKPVVEIDDTSHDWRDETERTSYLQSLGFEILRFTNEEVAKDLPAVVSTIETWVEELQAS